MALRVPIFNQLTYLAIAALWMLCSCRHNTKHEQNKLQFVTKTRPKVIHLKAKDDDYEKRADSISLFDLDLTEARKGDTVGFVSVSDIDRMPGSFNSPTDSVDNLVIPSLKNKTPEETRYLILNSRYRKRLLAGIGMSETDSLFIYDYSKNISLRFAIRSLDAVANLSIYEDASEAKHTARDYQFGFQINRASLAGLGDKYFTKTFVYIGAVNPFTQGKMYPVIWEKINEKNVPSIALKKEDLETLKGYKFNDAYKFESDGYYYYLQKYATNDSSSTAFRMLIMNTKNEVISNFLDPESESSSPAPISVLNNEKNSLEQWTGHLLKNRPPVLVGFDYTSYGCDLLPFVDKSNKYVRLNCDNRH
jgi:hypothetical protein